MLMASLSSEAENKAASTRAAQTLTFCRARPAQRNHTPVPALSLFAAAGSVSHPFA
jgi:hypothetical protein